MSSDRPSRTTRRRSRTRDSLIGAARELIAEGRAQTASIQEITDRADVGFGSFYNHFDSKPELFEAAAEAVLADWADEVNLALASLSDPAARFVTGIRLTGRLAATNPGFARELVQLGLRPLSTSTGLAPQARADLVNGSEQGRFRIEDIDVALGLSGGGLLALLQGVQGAADPELDLDRAFSLMSEHLLLAWGMSADEAQDLAFAALPPIG